MSAILSSGAMEAERDAEVARVRAIINKALEGCEPHQLPPQWKGTYVLAESIVPPVNHPPRKSVTVPYQFGHGSLEWHGDHNSHNPWWIMGPGGVRFEWFPRLSLAYPRATDTELRECLALVGEQP